MANGLLTVTLNSQYNDQSSLAMALGLDKADNSLADVTIINDIIKKHHFKKKASVLSTMLN
ncbi:hypothetical protein ACLKMH_20590 [Psychromonas sp. KJ10-10]|uniref:hypothetical protein n=1 Tax=Psychromonas sp. KJ10-10 TaxID=3391823 RepID=UPI0039B618F2